MTTISISQLKLNPSAALALAGDFPVQLKNRNKTAGYFLGKDLFEKMILYLEDAEDRKSIQKINLNKKRSFDDFASELGL